MCIFFLLPYTLALTFIPLIEQYSALQVSPYEGKLDIIHAWCILCSIQGRVVILAWGTPLASNLDVFIEHSISFRSAVIAFADSFHHGDSVHNNSDKNGTIWRMHSKNWCIQWKSTNFKSVLQLFGSILSHKLCCASSVSIVQSEQFWHISEQNDGYCCWPSCWSVCYVVGGYP